MFNRKYSTKTITFEANLSDDAKKTANHRIEMTFNVMSPLSSAFKCQEELENYVRSCAIDVLKKCLKNENTCKISEFAKHFFAKGLSYQDIGATPVIARRNSLTQANN